MYRTLEYILLFLIIALLQFFLFNNLGLGVYVNPLIYLSFLVMLPINLSRFWSLILALLVGLSMDLLMSTMGINTIACLFTGFIRPTTLALIIGSDDAYESGEVSVRRIGGERFLKFCSVIVILHCSIYFCFETANFSYFYLTLLRILISSIISIIFCYFTQYIFTLKK